ncbi:enoyl-CoA hydratase/isomerase family protein [Alteribacter natronophilus]|uniref:enoyl-CoA hydratase/isomerase family protein n=1 Tax=Alteribacter natronophilus TaxID=2583810 RepID=UPI001485E23D|nr:enoyl-CoA hydratase-related protein [Alteribacter natronophilus]
MNYETILVEVTEKVARVTLNLPDMRNPLTEKMAEELKEAITDLDQRNDVNAIILTGEGKAFSAGGNLKEFKSNFDKPVPQLHFEGRDSTELFKLGAQVSTPLIAAVNGPALGGGCGIVAMCHIAIASSEAKLGLTELRLGLVPFVILPWIRRAVGDRNAMEMMLSASVLTAEEAAEKGLVHRVVEPELLEEEVMKTAMTVASYSPLAVQLSMDAFYTTEQMDLMKSFDYLSTLRVVSFRSDDLKEGAAAFLEKRSPVWNGR